MNIEIKTNKGNEFDIEDSMYLTAVGESDICNMAFSFYNKELQYGISYFPDRNMFVFQTDNYEEEYWNDDKYNEMIKELDKHIKHIDNSEMGIEIDFNFIVNYFLDEMDKYYDWLNEKYKDFADYLKEFLSDV